jgi:hypothetical protein
MKYHLVSSVLLLAAMILFLSGISAAGTPLGALLVVAAAVCEFKLWGRLFGQLRH